MKISDFGFRKKISIGFTAISLVSMAIGGVVSYYFTSTIVHELTVHNLSEQIKGVDSAIQISTEENVEHQRKLIEHWAKPVLAQIEVKLSEKMGQLVENQETHEKSEISVPIVYVRGKKLIQHDFVDSISQQTGEVVTILVRVGSGFLRVSSSARKPDGTRNIGSYISSSSPIYASLERGERYIGRALIAGSWYTNAYEPIVQKGKVVGAFVMGSPETSSARIKNYLKSQKILKTGYFYIMSSAGELLLHPALEGKNVLASSDVDGVPIFKNIIEKKIGNIEYRWLNAETHKIQNKLAVFRYFPQMDWYVAASLNLEEANVDVDRLKWILFLITVGMTFAMAVVTVIFGGTVSKNLIGISSVLKNSEADLSQNSSELMTVSRALADATSDQASNLQETVMAVEQIRAMVLKNLDSTKVAESLSKKMSSLADGGQGILSGLINRVSAISSTNADLENEMKTSHHEIERIITVISSIEQKTQVINDIVFQTKLLSFNASVEAARAGEQGKGFSVVAEEVGRLATMSGNAAEDIRKSLEKSQVEVRSIIEQAKIKTENLIAESGKQIREGVSISEECKSTFSEIIEQANQTHHAIEGISQASKEQTLGIEEISNAMVRIEKTTQTNSTAAQKVKVLAEELQTHSSEMEGSVRKLSNFVSGVAQNGNHQDIVNRKVDSDAFQSESAA